MERLVQIAGALLIDLIGSLLGRRKNASQANTALLHKAVMHLAKRVGRLEYMVGEHEKRITTMEELGRELRGRVRRRRSASAPLPEASQRTRVDSERRSPLRSESGS